jgi:hypothetical protein
MATAGFEKQSMNIYNHRHSGTGRNPANTKNLRSRQKPFVPLHGIFFNHLDSGLRRNDELRSAL